MRIPVDLAVAVALVPACLADGELDLEPPAPTSLVAPPPVSPAWTRYIDHGGGDDGAARIARLPSGDFAVIAGVTGLSGDAWLGVVAANGSTVAVRDLFDGADGLGDIPADLLVRADGSTCYTLSSDSFSDLYDAVTRCIGPTGALLWSDIYRDPAGGNDVPRALRADATGNLYVLVESTNASGDPDVVVRSLTAGGAHRWTVRHQGPYQSFDFPSDLELDAAGNLYVAATSYASWTTSDMTTFALSPTGALRWMRTYHGPGAGADRASAVAVDDAGMIYVTGGSSGATWDVATLAYDAAGTLAWVHRHDSGGLDAGVDVEAAIDPDGDLQLYVAARTGNLGDIMTLRLDGAGGATWIQSYDHAGSHDYPTDLVLADGSVYVTGTGHAGVLATYDMVALRYDTSGGRRWAVSQDGGVGGIDAGSAIALSADRRSVVIAGGAWQGNDSDIALWAYAQRP